MNYIRESKLELFILKESDKSTKKSKKGLFSKIFGCSDHLSREIKNIEKNLQN